MKGANCVHTVRYDYSAEDKAVGVTDWVELEDDMPLDVNHIEVFDSSGQTMELGVGALGAEARVAIIVPGGNGRIPSLINENHRVAIRALSAEANLGEIIINFYR